MSGLITKQASFLRYLSSLPISPADRVQVRSVCKNPNSRIGKDIHSRLVRKPPTAPCGLRTEPKERNQVSVFADNSSALGGAHWKPSSQYHHPNFEGVVTVRAKCLQLHTSWLRLWMPRPLLVPSTPYATHFA